LSGEASADVVSGGKAEAEEKVETPGSMLQAALAQEAAEMEDLRAKVAVKEATLDSMRVVVARAEAAGSSNADALREVSVQMAELQQEYLGWQQTVLAGRLDSLKADSARIAENDRLKSEVGQTLEALEARMNSLDKELAARDAEAKQLQAQLDEATGTVSPPPPRVNGTKVRKVLSDGSNPAEGADGAGPPIRIDATRVQEPVIPIQSRPRDDSGRQIGVAVAAAALGAFQAGKGLFGGLFGSPTPKKRARKERASDDEGTRASEEKGADEGDMSSGPGNT